MKSLYAIPLAAALLAGGFMQSAQAALGQVGPVNPANGFPVWYQDNNGLRLDLCLDQTGFCLLEEPNPAAPIAFPNNFGPEAFWWMAEAAFDNTATTGLNGLLVLAVEAAFANENPIEGDQVAFARIRVRVDVPVPGTYTVTHPFGSQTFTVPDAVAPDVFDGTKAIDFTDDVGSFATPGRDGNFATVLAGNIGPFLTRADGLTFTDPITGNTYLSPPGAATTVTGSPTGNNFFRVSGPSGTSQTNSFVLMGKVSANQPAQVAKGEYRSKTGKFLAQGFSTIVETAPGVPTVITVRIGAADGPVLGTADVNPTTGLWRLSGKAPVSPGAAGTKLFISSSADPIGLPTEMPLSLR